MDLLLGKEAACAMHGGSCGGIAAAAVALGEARPGQPDDGANSVAFLASPGSAHVNGMILVVDGGAIAAI